MPTTTQFVISEQSKPGVLAQVAAVLGGAGVNIKAFLAPEVTAGKGKLRLVVADPDNARTALRKAKVKFREETALILSLENKPGAQRIEIKDASVCRVGSVSEDGKEPAARVEKGPEKTKEN